jgi:hypothetical protein
LGAYLRKKKSKALLLAVLFLLALTTMVNPAWARIGVGVNVGNIKVNEKLVPGRIVRLPSIGVINTGTKKQSYTLGTAYNQQQTELKVPLEWLRFSPQVFKLKPNKVQQVEITLDLPINAEPGRYFAYVEARPVYKDKKNVRIAVAAATKLYFTIKPANRFSALLWKLRSWWKEFWPYSGIGAALLALSSAGLVFKRFFKLRLGLERRGKEGPG